MKLIFLRSVFLTDMLTFGDGSGLEVDVSAEWFHNHFSRSPHMGDVYEFPDDLECAVRFESTAATEQKSMSLFEDWTAALAKAVARMDAKLIEQVFAREQLIEPYEPYTMPDFPTPACNCHSLTAHAKWCNAYEDGAAL